MIHSYFQHPLQNYTMVSFDEDIWTIVYYYTGKSYTFTGHEVNKTSKSGSRLAFVKRYLYPGQKCLIFANGKLLGECCKLNGRMQLPISSLNEEHWEEYEFHFDSVFAYHLEREELNAITVISEDAEVKAILNIPALYEEEEEKKLPIEVEMDFEE